MDDLHATPRLTGSQPPAAEPTCGSSLPSVPGRPPCGEPATWHVLWCPGPNGSASLACQAHMDQIVAFHAWYERHPATAACAGQSPTWHADRCTT